uniref:DNA-directed RNA polymerase n=1 Tax=Globodera pallida TaxID=36090 RepID=A0A183C6R9_GLOPA
MGCALLVLLFQLSLSIPSLTRFLCSAVDDNFPPSMKRLFNCNNNKNGGVLLRLMERRHLLRHELIVEPWHDESARNEDGVIVRPPPDSAEVESCSKEVRQWREREAVAALQAAKRSRWEGNMRRARSIIEHAYSLAPYNPDILTEYGIYVEMARSDVVQAEGFYLKALARNPRHEEALIRRQKALPLVEEIDNRMMREIERKRDRFMRIPHNDSGLKRSMRESYFAYVYHTVAMEGNTINLAQTRSILETRMAVAGKSIVEHNEILGLDAALRYLNQSLLEVQEITLEVRGRAALPKFYEKSGKFGLEKEAMLSAKETKEMCCALMDHSFITVRQLARTNDFAPARTFFLYTVSAPQVLSAMVSFTTLALNNVIRRRMLEREKHERGLALQAAKRSRWEGNMRRARSIIEHAYSLAPYNPDILTEYGIYVEMARSDVVQAEGFYLKALARNPRHEEALIRRQKALPLVEEIDNRMMREIERKRDRFMRIPHNDSGLKRSMRESYFAYVYHTVAMEGNTINLAQTRSILETRMAVAGKSIVEHNEILGLDAALRYLNQSLLEVQEITLEHILALHKRVLGFADPLSAGVIRNVQVS